MADVTIPAGLFEEFRNFGSSESSENEAIQDNSKEFESLEKVAKWLIDVADKTAKENKLVGIGTLKSEDIAELTVIVAKRNLSPIMIQKSPEFMLASMFAGLIATNYLGYQRLRKNELSKPKDKETGE